MLGGGVKESNVVTNLWRITFFEFRWLVKEGELDGVIIADSWHIYCKSFQPCFADLLA